MLRFLLSLVLLSAMACGSTPPTGGRKEPMDLGKVPEKIMKIAKEKLPDVEFDRAFRLSNGDYEIRGKNKSGKVREIEISPEGEVKEIQ